MLKINDKWVWDFWLANDNNKWYCYFLQADKSLKDPDLRHNNVTQGLATSKDLINWDYYGTVLSPSKKENFDDYTVWTGSILKENSKWHYFYTGRNKKEKGVKQRIGHALGNSLYSFERCDNGLALDLDPDIYLEFTENGFWKDQAMRDPWVMKHPKENKYIMAYTARASIDDDPYQCGVIGMAESINLYDWKSSKPLFGGLFSQLEVPQIFQVNNKWYCLFCNHPEDWSDEFKKNYNGPIRRGTHYLISDNFDGPWEIAPGSFLTSEAEVELYAGRILQIENNYFFMAFLHDDKDGNFIGEISDPIPLSFNSDGIMSLNI